MGSSEIIPARPGDIVVYRSESGLPEIECVFHGENMWLSQAHMVDLYQVSKKTISEHINNILDEGELGADSVVRKFRTTAADGKSYQVNYYSLEMVIAGELTSVDRDYLEGVRGMRKRIEGRG